MDSPSLVSDYFGENFKEECRFSPEDMKIKKERRSSLSFQSSKTRLDSEPYFFLAAFFVVFLAAFFAVFFAVFLAAFFAVAIWPHLVKIFFQHEHNMSRILLCDIICASIILNQALILKKIFIFFAFHLIIISSIGISGSLSKCFRAQ